MIHPLNCKEVTRRLALGELDHYRWFDRVMVRFHLAICWVCRKYERQMKVIGNAFSRSLKDRLEHEDLSGFQRRLIERLGKQ